MKAETFREELLKGALKASKDLEQPKEVSAYEKYTLEMKKTALRVFGPTFDKILPLIKWEECSEAPGAFFIYLLSPARRSSEVHLFFHEMVSHWLVPKDRLHILSSDNLTFHPKSEKGPACYFEKLLVHVEKEEHLPLIHKNLPTLQREICLAVESKGYVKHVLEMKRLIVGGKTSEVYETILSARKRYPKHLEEDIFRDIHRFLAHVAEEYCEVREARHLSRLILTHYYYKKTLQRESVARQGERRLYFKLHATKLHFPFGLKKVLSLALVMNTLREYECFEERHVLKALQRCLPHVRVIADSYYHHRDSESKLLLLSLEFEKSDGEDFSAEELLTFKKKLSAELKNSIEYLSPSLFIPRNEEELYRNIISLSGELKYVHDLPQAMISFQEQNLDKLKFNVTLLRILHPKSPSLETLSHKLGSDERFLPERVTPVGHLRKKYTKEANIFSIEVAAKHFLRKNHSVDLVRARAHVVRLIEQLIDGPFRDYNGGFLLKQNEQLESIKKEIGDEEKQNEFLIENLFYSLTPSIMQTLIPPDAGKALCALFLRTKDLPLPKRHKFLLEKMQTQDFLAACIKVKHSGVLQKLNESLKKLNVEALKLTSGLVEVDGWYCICYLYLNPTKEQGNSFLELLASTLDEWVLKQSDLQTLRLHLPRATQSLDPRIGADRTSGIVIKMLFEGLMRIGSDGKPECALAKEVTVSADKLRYTFTLKKTSWSNGYDLTAYDFEYAWKKILDPSFRSPYSFLLDVIKNADKAKRGVVPLTDVGIYVIDNYTLVVELEYPAIHFLGLTAHWTYSPLCKEIDQRHPGWAYHNAETHVCNGPFKLNVWKLNDDLEVVKNPLYWDAPSVKIDKIEVHIVEDDFRALEMFKRGELDWFGDPITKIPLKELYKLQEEMPVEGKSLAGLFWLQLNIQQFPFTNTKFRKAFAYAIDRGRLIKEVLMRDDDPALGFFRGENAEARFQDGHIKMARQLFEEALHEEGLKTSDLPAIVFTHSDIDEHVSISCEIGRQWEEAFQVRVEYERLPWNTYFDTLNKQDYMVGGLSWYSRYEDPLYYLDLMIWRESSVRVTLWKNEKFISLVESAKRELDLEKRSEYIRAAEKIVIDEMPLIPILFDRWRYIKNPRLKGINLTGIGQIDFKESYLDGQF